MTSVSLPPALAALVKENVLASHFDVALVAPLQTPNYKEIYLFRLFPQGNPEIKLLCQQGQKSKSLCCGRAIRLTS